jgi:hypothetical protein
MDHTDILVEVFKLLMFLVMLMAFYFFIATVVYKDRRFKQVFSNWQFPMLFALFIDAIFIE